MAQEKHPPGGRSGGRFGRSALVGQRWSSGTVSGSAGVTRSQLGSGTSERRRSGEVAVLPSHYPAAGPGPGPSRHQMRRLTERPADEALELTFFFLV